MSSPPLPRPARRAGAPQRPRQAPTRPSPGGGPAPLDGGRACAAAGGAAQSAGGPVAPRGRPGYERGAPLRLLCRPVWAHARVGARACMPQQAPRLPAADRPVARRPSRPHCPSAAPALAYSRYALPHPVRHPESRQPRCRRLAGALVLCVHARPQASPRAGGARAPHPEGARRPHSTPPCRPFPPCACPNCSAPRVCPPRYATRVIRTGCQLGRPHKAACTCVSPMPACDRSP
jgi:hypothetical protein